MTVGRDLESAWSVPIATPGTGTELTPGAVASGGVACHARSAAFIAARELGPPPNKIGLHYRRGSGYGRFERVLEDGRRIR